MNNPSLSLLEYIENHKNDSGGDWEYGHTPYIQNVLDHLNKEQTDEFCKRIWNWSEFHLSELADPILFCSNKFVDRFHLYMKIFGKLTDIEKLEYFAQNIGISLPIATIKNWDIEDLINILENIRRVTDYIKSEDYGGQYKSIEHTLELVIKNKTANTRL